MTGDIGEAFSFGRYASALAQEMALDPSGGETIKIAVLGTLAVGALALFAITIIRRSGTAAAGFAVLALVGLALGIVFGQLSFITPGTSILIGTLTSSALLLFVNAVLHTGRENLLLAGLSAMVIGVLLMLGVLTVAGLGFAQEARLGMLGATVLSAGLLVFAMVRDFAGKAVLGLSVLLAILAALLMTDPLVGLWSDTFPIIVPPVMIAAGLLIAAITSPFLGDDIQLVPSRDRGYPEPGLAPGSLFADDLPMPAGAGVNRALGGSPARVTPAAPQPGPAQVAPSRDALAAEPPAPGTFPNQNDRSAGRWPGAETRFAAAGRVAGAAAATRAAQTADPVSNYWHDQGSAVVEAEANEYVWDALASPEVRCGDQLLEVWGARSASDLTPEGLRAELDPASLAVFDEQVLGGADPVSGPFELPLQTAGYRFVFRGRRQVDHDGILMRIDAEITDVDAVPQKNSATGGSVPADLDAQAAARLSDGQVTGFEVNLGRMMQTDQAQAKIDAAGALLAALAAAGTSGPFGIIDASAAALRPGVLASAVGKAVRHHNLPRGALVVAFRAPSPREAKTVLSQMDDVRRAGGGVALMVDGPKSRLPKGLEPDMLLVSALDVMTGRRGRKSALGVMAQKFSGPVVVRDLRDGQEARDAAAEGAVFGSGRAFAGLPLPVGAHGQAPGFQGESRRSEAAPADGPISSLRANGLR